MTRGHPVGPIHVRTETARDQVAVSQVHTRAFRLDAESRLVDALRGRTDPQVSLVAEQPADGVIGHILFTPVEIVSPAKRSSAIALGPMAVSPEHQRTGVGFALVQAGLSTCAEAGEFAVVVLGHPDYYRRFGFQPAWDFGLYDLTRGRTPVFRV